MKSVALAASWEQFRNWCGEKRYAPNDFIVITRDSDLVKLAGLEPYQLYKVGTWDQLPKPLIAHVREHARTEAC